LVFVSEAEQRQAQCGLNAGPFGYRRMMQKTGPVVPRLSPQVLETIEPSWQAPLDPN
jgi:hypothetical protein